MIFSFCHQEERSYWKMILFFPFVQTLQQSHSHFHHLPRRPVEYSQSKSTASQNLKIINLNFASKPSISIAGAVDTSIQHSHTLCCLCAVGKKNGKEKIASFFTRDLCHKHLCENVNDFIQPATLAIAISLPIFHQPAVVCGSSLIPLHLHMILNKYMYKRTRAESWIIEVDFQ